MLLISEQKSTYPIALLLSSTGKKTSEALGRTLNKSGDTVLRLLEHHAVASDQLVDFSKTIFKNRELYLILDDTLIEKMYSKAIQGTSDNRDHSNGQIYRSLCSVVAMVTDGIHGIAIDHILWTSREIAQEHYKSKTHVAQELIESIVSKVNIKVVIMDGLYATKELIKWLQQKNLFFEMRFHSNRRLKDISGKSFVLRECRDLKLTGRMSSSTIAAYWKDELLFFTAVRRKSKNNSIVLYQVSNYSTTSAYHKLFYSYRWNIEKFFRTAKQHLGLKDCQSTKQKLQKNHIMNVFYSYAILQSEAINKDLLNPERALNLIRHSFYQATECHLSLSDQIFRHLGFVYA